MGRIPGIMCAEEETEEETGWVCGGALMCVRVSHLALPPIPPPSPPHPPGHRTSAAGSAGDTRQMPDLPSSRFSWPETRRERDTEEERERVCVCWWSGLCERGQWEAAAGTKCQGRCKTAETQQGRK